MAMPIAWQESYNDCAAGRDCEPLYDIGEKEYELYLNGYAAYQNENYGDGYYEDNK